MPDPKRTDVKSILKNPTKQTINQVAQDLKQYHQRLLANLRGNEFKTDPSECGEHIVNLTKSYDDLSFRARDDILNASSKGEQQKVFRFYVELLDACYKQNDYHAAHAILSGLSFATIQGLKYLSKDNKIANTLDKYDKLFSPVGNYKASSNDIKNLKANSPTVEVVPLFVPFNVMYTRSGENSVYKNKLTMQAKTLYMFADQLSNKKPESTPVDVDKIVNDKYNEIYNKLVNEIVMIGGYQAALNDIIKGSKLQPSDLPQTEDRIQEILKYLLTDTDELKTLGLDPSQMKVISSIPSSAKKAFANQIEKEFGNWFDSMRPKPDNRNSLALNTNITDYVRTTHMSEDDAFIRKTHIFPDPKKAPFNKMNDEVKRGNVKVLTQSLTQLLGSANIHYQPQSQSKPYDFVQIMFAELKGIDKEQVIESVFEPMIKALKAQQIESHIEINGETPYLFVKWDDIKNPKVTNIDLNGFTPAFKKTQENAQNAAKSNATLKSLVEPITTLFDPLKVTMKNGEIRVPLNNANPDIQTEAFRTANITQIALRERFGLEGKIIMDDTKKYFVIKLADISPKIQIDTEQLLKSCDSIDSVAVDLQKHLIGTKIKADVSFIPSEDNRNGEIRISLPGFRRNDKVLDLPEMAINDEDDNNWDFLNEPFAELGPGDKLPEHRESRRAVSMPIKAALNSYGIKASRNIDPKTNIPYISIPVENTQEWPQDFSKTLHRYQQEYAKSQIRLEKSIDRLEKLLPKELKPFEINSFPLGSEKSEYKAQLRIRLNARNSDINTKFELQALQDILAERGIKSEVRVKHNESFLLITNLSSKDKNKDKAKDNTKLSRALKEISKSDFRKEYALAKEQKIQLPLDNKAESKKETVSQPTQVQGPQPRATQSQLSQPIVTQPSAEHPMILSILQSLQELANSRSNNSANSENQIRKSITFSRASQGGNTSYTMAIQEGIHRIKSIKQIDQFNNLKPEDQRKVVEQVTQELANLNIKPETASLNGVASPRTKIIENLENLKKDFIPQKEARKVQQQKHQ